MSVNWDAVNLLVVVASFVVGMTAITRTPRSRRWKGRHISIPLVRRLGAHRARTCWRSLMFLRFALLAWACAGGPDLPWILLFVLDVARDVDDWLFSDDDDRRDERFRNWIKLRMPKPVFLRPVERWGGAV